MSDRSVHRALLVLTVAGLAIALYLTIVHYSGGEPVCAGGSGGCEKVQESDYATAAGIPVALIGLAGYALILATLLAGQSESVRLTAAGLSAGGAFYSGYLTMVSLTEIDATCQWCVASAAIMIALAVLSAVRYLRPTPGTATAARSASRPAPAGPRR